MTDTMTATPLLVEQAIPAPDAQIARHRIVAAPPDRVLACVRDLDFLQVRTPLLDAAMWVRGLPARLRGDELPVPPSMRLGDAFEAGAMQLPGWVVLGETDRELAIGAIGKVWQPDIEWLEPTPHDLASFRDPGWAKIAASFSVTAYGSGSTLLTYDCRVAGTDPGSTRRFRRYWGLIRPFVGHIFSATLATVAKQAEGR